MVTSRAAPASSRGLSAAVVSVIVIFCAIYTTAAFGLLEELELTVPGVSHLAILTTLTGCALVAYAGCVLRDAGPVPPHWQPDTECASQNLEVKRKGGNQRRFCQKCSSFKPPRAHHCRVCNRCVLRMDHHCMWINNCVGHRNYKAFVLFLIYTVLALAHAAAALAGLVGHHHSVAADPAAGFQRSEPLQQKLDGTADETLAHVWRLAMCALATVIMVLLVLLLAWHVYLMIQNKTTIEHHEGVRARGLEPSYLHPYHLGVAANLLAVAGSHPAAWCLPTAFAVDGNGLTYPMPEALRTHLHGMTPPLAPPSLPPRVGPRGSGYPPSEGGG